MTTCEPTPEPGDILPYRTDRERAAGYLKRRRPPRPKAPPQEDALFAEPEPSARRLVAVDGWPDDPE